MIAGVAAVSAVAVAIAALIRRKTEAIAQELDLNRTTIILTCPMRMRTRKARKYLRRQNLKWKKKFLPLPMKNRSMSLATMRMKKPESDAG